MDYDPLLFNNCVIASFHFVLVLFCVLFSWIRYRTKKKCNFVLIASAVFFGEGGVAGVSPIELF